MLTGQDPLIDPRLFSWTLKLQPLWFKIEAVPGVDSVGADWLRRSAWVENATLGQFLFWTWSIRI